MSTRASHLTPHDTPGPQAADTHAPDPHGYRDTLHTLIGFGTNVARLLHDQAVQQAAAPAPANNPAQPPPNRQPAPPPNPLIAIAAAFDGASRNVRRCIALARSLDRPAPNPSPTRTAARKRILRAVEDAIHRATDGPSTDSRADADVLRAERQAELLDRLDSPDLDEDLTHRPIPDIIADLCRDLGLAAQPGQPWPRRTPADIALLRARAASHPGVPKHGAAQDQAPPRGAAAPASPTQLDPAQDNPVPPRPAIPRARQPGLPSAPAPTAANHLRIPRSLWPPPGD